MSEDWLAVVLLTYARKQYAEKTLRSTLDRLRYDGPISVVIADDGTPEEGYRENLKVIAGGYSRVKTTAITNSERGGYGRNYNLATQVYHSFAKYALVLEDDWELTHALSIEDLLPALAEGTGIDCIRLGYLGFTDVLKGYVAYHGFEHYLVFDADSPEKHVFAGHARLETVARQKRIGPWPEGLLPGETELAVCAMPEARKGVAWPMDLVKPRGDLFMHIGSERAY